jgi:hypothetical protein
MCARQKCKTHCKSMGYKQNKPHTKAHFCLTCEARNTFCARLHNMYFSSLRHFCKWKHTRDEAVQFVLQPFLQMRTLETRSFRQRLIINVRCQFSLYISQHHSQCLSTMTPRQGIGFPLHKVQVLLTSIEKILPVCGIERYAVKAEHGREFPEREDVRGIRMSHAQLPGDAQIVSTGSKRRKPGVCEEDDGTMTLFCRSWQTRGSLRYRWGVRSWN